jgi:hypothetical protein
LLAIAAALSAPAHALYDPPPLIELAPLPGEWRGSLTYDDCTRPGRLVTLPTTLFVALIAPDELTLHYVFDDGPGKRVYLYEKMRFDFAKGEVAWTTGVVEKESSISRIVSDTTAGGVRQLVFEQPADGGAPTTRYTLQIGSRTFSLKQEAIGAAGTARFRNHYELNRPGG